MTGCTKYLGRHANSSIFRSLHVSELLKSPRAYCVACHQYNPWMLLLQAYFLYCLHVWDSTSYLLNAFHRGTEARPYSTSYWVYLLEQSCLPWSSPERRCWFCRRLHLLERTWCIVQAHPVCPADQRQRRQSRCHTVTNVRWYTH